MFTRHTPQQPDTHAHEPDIGPLLAAEVAIEYQSLRAPGNCPAGMYLIPTPESLLRWAGVCFVHRGPYAGSILRFTVTFPTNFPRARPAIHFESDVFHPLVDPKTREWIPRGRLATWQPKVDHIPQLLHGLKASFKKSALDAVTEADASNRQVWSMYHHSPQTFLSLTAQRARHSCTRQALYDESDPVRRGHAAQPATPGASASPSTSSPIQQPRREDQHIHFTELDDGAVGRLWADLRRSLGER